ncbi:MAG: hypothetical protein LBS87_00960 [Puniceicoccales bacterium]|nr:hypothetical protein [Puniceicoccales bacterium]
MILHKKKGGSKFNKKNFMNTTSKIGSANRTNPNPTPQTPVSNRAIKASHQTPASSSAKRVPSAASLPQRRVKKGDVQATLQRLQRKALDNYPDKDRRDNSISFPKLAFASKNPVFCSDIKENLEEKGQKTSKYLNDFFDQTGVNVSKCGRTIVNMSGEENFCGYRAILSQVDPECGGIALANRRSGGTKSMDEDVLEKICQLRLTVAVGRIRDALPNSSNELKSLGVNASYILEDLMGSMLNAMDTEDIALISQALGKKIVVVGISLIGSAQMEIINPDGQHDFLGFPEGEIEAKEALIREMQDPNTIILHYVNNNHFMAVQRVNVPAPSNAPVVPVRNNVPTAPTANKVNVPVAKPAVPNVKKETQQGIDKAKKETRRVRVSSAANKITSSFGRLLRLLLFFVNEAMSLFYWPRPR